MQPNPGLTDLNDVLSGVGTLEEQKARVEGFLRQNPRACGPLLQLLVQANHGLRTKAAEMEKACTALSETLNAPPNTLAVLHYLLEGDPARALVGVNGRQFTVAVAAEVDLSALGSHQYVFLNAEGNVLLRAAPSIVSPRHGAVAELSRWHAERAVVHLGNDEELVLDLAKNLRNSGLRQGELLLIDRENQIAWERISSRHKPQSLLEDLPANLRIEQLPGMEHIFREIVGDAQLHLSQQDLVREMQLDPLRSLLLIGPPGCGKTSLVGCVASQLGEATGKAVRAVLVRPSVHRSKWFGESEERVRAVFAEVRAIAASGAFVLVFFDDMDHLGSRDTFQEVDARILPTFLGEVEAIRQVPGVLLVGATNRPDLIDSALLRAGRFGDRRFRVPRPSSRAAVGAILRRYLPGELPFSPNGCSGVARREEILESALSAMFAPNGDLSELATLHFRDGSKRPLSPAMLMSGAFLKAASEEAKRRSALRAARGGPKGITCADVLSALDQQFSDQVAELKPGPSLHQLLELPADADVVKLAVPARRRRPKLHHHLLEEAH